MGKVSTRVNMIRVGAANIKAWAEQIIENINDDFNADPYENLSIIENLMDRIEREAEGTKDDIMEAYDEIEEE